MRLRIQPFWCPARTSTRRRSDTPGRQIDDGPGIDLAKKSLALPGVYFKAHVRGRFFPVTHLFCPLPSHSAELPRWFAGSFRNTVDQSDRRNFWLGFAGANGDAGSSDTGGVDDTAGSGDGLDETGSGGLDDAGSGGSDTEDTGLPGGSGGDEGGCACRASPSPRGAAWWAVVLVAFVTRSRRGRA